MMGYNRDRDDQGQFQSEVSDEEIIAAVKQNEPAGTQEVADEVGIARQSADYRLRHLQEEGHISVNKVGGSLIWSVND